MAETKKCFPKLRFPEFDKKWGFDKIGKITDIKAGGTPSTYKKDYWNGDILWMNSGELNLKRVYDVENRITSEGLKNSSTRLIPVKCILIGLAGQGKTRGTTAINYVELCTNQSIATIYPNENIFDSEFLYHNIDSRYKELRNLSTGAGGRGSLNLSIVSSFEVPLPSLNEQKKIASFLTSVDDKITKLTKKKDLLEQYKKGVMQKIFNQELRFKDDNGNDYPKWRKGRIDEFGYFYYGKSAPKFSLSKDAPTPCVRYGELYSAYDEVITEIKSYTNIEPENLKFSKGGEVLVPRVGEDPLDFANCSYLPIPNVAIGEMISVYNTKENGLFITYYFNAKLREKFARVVEGANVSNLYFKYLEGIEIVVPCIEEQNKIVEFLTDITSKIDYLKTKIKKAQSFKKGLLQQMFV